VLVLIDQHAADERVRVERFLKELCNGAVQGGAESTALDPKKGVILTRDEATFLQETVVLQELRRWGLRVEPVTIIESLTANWVQVDVLAVPALLRDRVRFPTSFYMASTQEAPSCYRATNFKTSSKDVSRSTKSKVVHGGPMFR